MIRTLIRSTIAMAALTVICGIAYPAVVLAIGQVAFKDSAQGSLVSAHGRVVGSTLIGQPFVGAKWFVPRPSAVAYETGAAGGTTGNSGGTNLGPNSKLLATGTAKLAAALATSDGVAVSSLPVDLAQSSGSGLDPDISLAGALVQVDRVAAARGLDPQLVRRLVTERADGPVLGVFGTHRVNVLDLNLALERLSPQ